LYEIREEMSKYTPKFVQVLERTDEFSLPIHLQTEYQTSYNHVLYGGRTSSMYVPNVGTKFSFCGNSYMIAKSNIHVSNIGLFIR
jgi:hypothetical protein